MWFDLIDQTYNTKTKKVRVSNCVSQKLDVVSAGELNLKNKTNISKVIESETKIMFMLTRKNTANVYYYNFTKWLLLARCLVN